MEHVAQWAPHGDLVRVLKPPARRSQPDMVKAMEQNWPLLLYDGTCGFCHATVRFVLRRDIRGTLRFASLQGENGRAVIDTHQELVGVDSVIWVETNTDGKPSLVLTRSSAALRIARYLGGAWRLLLVLWIVPRPLRDWIYDRIARHRHRLMGATDDCVVPPADARGRFLDENP